MNGKSGWLDWWEGEVLQKILVCDEYGKINAMHVWIDRTYMQDCVQKTRAWMLDTLRGPERGRECKFYGLIYSQTSSGILKIKFVGLDGRSYLRCAQWRCRGKGILWELVKILCAIIWKEWVVWIEFLLDGILEGSACTDQPRGANRSG